MIPTRQSRLPQQVAVIRKHRPEEDILGASSWNLISVQLQRLPF